MEETQISVKEKQHRTSKEAENFRVTEGSLASLKMTFAISRRGPSGCSSLTHWVWRLNRLRAGTISCAKQWALHLRGRLGELNLRKTFY